MRLYYGGAEIPAWRTLFETEGITDVSFSFYGLTRRVKHAALWTLEGRVPASFRIFLDSGAYSLNKDSTLSVNAREIASGYEEFVSNNIGSVEMVSEFDAVVLGHDYILERRAAFYDDLGDQFIPVWHADHGGLAELERLASVYSRVAVTEADIDGRDLTPALNNLVARYGVKLHGASLTGMEMMRSVRWESVGSTSWMSPAHYGDTIIWTGSELKRYPVKYKEQARKRHRVMLEENGFDAAKIADDDRTEVLRLSLWSWQHFVADISRHSVTRPAQSPGIADGETGDGEVDSTLMVAENGQLRLERATEPIPLLQSSHEAPRFRVRSESMRMCNTCFLKGKCPGFEADANCLYNIPVRLATDEDMANMQNGLIEMQAQRVLFMQMSEQIEGGYADPNLSNEMDRLQRMIKAKREGEQIKIVRKSEESVTGAGSKIAEMFGLKQEMPATPADEIIQGELE